METIERDVVQRVTTLLQDRNASIDPDHALSEAKQLRAREQFGLARVFLKRIMSREDLDPDVRRNLGHQEAYATYKDTHLSEDERLDAALLILHESDDLATTNANCEANSSMALALCAAEM